MTHSIHLDAEGEVGEAAAYYATHASRAVALQDRESDFRDGRISVIRPAGQ